MVGSGVSSSVRVHGADRAMDRFYYPPAMRKQTQMQYQPVKPKPPPPPPSPPAAVAESRETENRVDDSCSKHSVSPLPYSLYCPPPRPLPPAENLERFLESTTPIVPAHYFSKTSVREWSNCDAGEFHPYYNLGDLWESFGEWSAYGAGVPLVLNGGDSVVQYYVPYLSGMQLYVDSSRPTLRSRRPGEESDGELYQDTSSDASSENEADQQRASIRTTSRNGQEGFSSDDGELCSPSTVPVFEYLERDSPYGREPLAVKISVLARKFPNLKTYKSCDLLPCSWISVAWYPIYKIPAGPTIRDLDACFLTFHSLATPLKITDNEPTEVLGPCSIRIATSPTHTSAKLSLPVFGLACYKLKGSTWSSDGLNERQRTSSLLQAADSWLRRLHVHHPDFHFFVSRSYTR